MTTDSAGEIVHTADEAAAVKSSAKEFDAPRWFANLWGDVPAAIAYANENPVSGPGAIIFNIRDNGQVWTYDFR
jgi:hypothetical protein